MSDPKPHHLKDKPQRAQPWQPDKPGADVHRADTAPADPAVAASGTPATTASTGDEVHSSRKGDGRVRPHVREQVEGKTSPEADIPRDPMNGQAINDESLTSGRDSQRSDGAAGSMHLPES